MSIEYPETFGEAFWSPHVDALKAYDDEAERSLKPFIEAIQAVVSGYEETPAFVSSMLSAFGSVGNFGLKEVGSGAAVNTASGFINEAMSPFMRSLQYAVNLVKPNKLLDVPSAAILRFNQAIDNELYESIAKRHGYEESIAGGIYRSLLPYPSIAEWIEYLRYTLGDAGLHEEAQKHVDIREEFYPVFDFGTRTRLTGAEIQQLYVRGTITPSQAETELIRLGYLTEAIPHTLSLAFDVPNASIVLQHALLRQVSEEEIPDMIQKAGVSPEYTQAYIDAVLTKPDLTTLISYLRRVDPSLATLETEAKRIGVHPNYIPMFRELAYPIPPVSDIITMAVREAFSPEIATRFGQYEDYPSDLTRYGQMQGISEEWSRRYWAAHWSLPSPNQGFEMLHRGVITTEELNLLLRALDVMPFWREKLIQISYNPLTRVDVRRMYGLGVLNESEVARAYRDIGYTAENADRLREFTVRQTVSSQSGLSVSKIITAYKNGYTTRQDAYNAISSLGVRPQTISEILESADLQLSWQRVKDRISAVRNLFKKERLTEEQARGELNSLRLDGNKIDLLIHQWVNEVEDAHGTLLSKTDVLTLIKKQLINRQRAEQELSLLGYTTERVGLLLATVT